MADPAARARALDDADDLQARAAAAGAGIIQQGYSEYPGSLSELHDPPPWLSYRGQLALLGAPSVAVVGTRRATQYGERVPHQLAAAFARAGIVVVSGLARGIDAIAHRAALEAGGTTIAVLGTGVDVAYPVAHRALQEEVASRGLLLSEEWPTSRATSASFPKRNRIIAAIARATIIVEAPLKSGALITADHAIDLARSVAAVPGQIDLPQSAGSNLLLRDGAILIASVDDALALVGAAAPVKTTPELHTPAEQRVWDALSSGSVDLDNLAALARLPARDCLAAVTTLELRGVVACDLTGEVRRT